jgi:hypothetical protein
VRHVKGCRGEVRGKGERLVVKRIFIYSTSIFRVSIFRVLKAIKFCVYVVSAPHLQHAVSASRNEKPERAFGVI